MDLTNALRALIMALVGGLLFYVLFRVLKKGGHGAGLFTMWLAEPVTVLFGGDVASPLHINPKAKPFQDALSREAHARAVAWLESLRPGDAVEIALSQASHPRTGIRVLLGDGWIGDYSGRNLTREQDIGQPTALEGDMLYGTHLFGHLIGHHLLAPTHRLITRARITMDEVPLTAREKRDHGGVAIWQGGREHKLRLHGVEMHEVIVMEAQKKEQKEQKEHGEQGDQAALEALEMLDHKDKVTAVFQEPLTQERFRAAERVLEALPEGCPRWEMIARLGGRLVTLSGVEAVMCMDGYLNFKGDHRWSKYVPEGIFLALPFGYLEGNREVPQLVAVFRNGNLHKLLPHAPREDLERELGL